MEDKFYYQLVEFLRSPINLSQTGEGFFINNVPVKDFPFYADTLASRFIGECTRNIVNHNETKLLIIQEFDTLRFKLARYFLDKFRVEFDDASKKLNYDIFGIKAVDNEEALKTALVTVWNTYHLVIDFLDNKIDELDPFKELKNKKSTNWKKSRRKPEYHEFNFDIPGVILLDTFNTLVRKGFIADDTDPKDFIDAFNGRKLNNPIHWQKSNYKLRYLISKINKLFDKKLHDGIWYLTRHRFVKKDGAEFTEKELMRASGSNDNDTAVLDGIVASIEDERENET